MAMDYDTAAAELYRSPLADFVATRKRLAVELKTTDKAQAKRFEKLARPSLSAWAVNQLWWRARPSFDALFESAARLRTGDQAATRAHRDALAELRRRAAELLAENAHAASEAVLRRVTHTLSALAASGGFDPDPPGALVEDRDPPGFEAIDPTALATQAAMRATLHGKAERTEAPAPARPRDARARERNTASARAEAAAAERERAEQERKRIEQERKRIEQERKRARAEREGLERELKKAEAAAELRAREADRCRQALVDAERELERALAAVADVRARLAGSGQKNS